jgi:hypothetical protein
MDENRQLPAARQPLQITSGNNDARYPSNYPGTAPNRGRGGSARGYPGYPRGGNPRQTNNYAGPRQTPVYHGESIEDDQDEFKDHDDKLGHAYWGNSPDDIYEAEQTPKAPEASWTEPPHDEQLQTPMSRDDEITANHVTTTYDIKCRTCHGTFPSKECPSPSTAKQM